MKMSPADRFMRRVRKDIGGCWMWVGARKPTGYGNFYLAGKHVNAHKAAWLLFKGEITNGLVVCHSCDVPSCVNPEHLFIGTHLENMQDMRAKGRSPKRDHRGTRNGRAKLSESDALHIRADPRPTQQIANEFGVCYQTIWKLRRGHAWSHL